MNFPNDVRIEGLQPIGLGVGTGETGSGRTIHRGELFYIFKRIVESDRAIVLVWGESWREDYITCWWIDESYLIPIDDVNNIEPSCGVCKSRCERDEPCAFFIGVWEVNESTPLPL